MTILGMCEVCGNESPLHGGLCPECDNAMQAWVRPTNSNSPIDISPTEEWTNCGCDGPDGDYDQGGLCYECARTNMDEYKGNYN